MLATAYPFIFDTFSIPSSIFSVLFHEMLQSAFQERIQNVTAIGMFSL